MAQEVLNSTNNINQPHNVSLWFQQDYAGSYYELGDLVVDGVALAPEFAEHYSYRNGIRALRKRLLTNRAASITATLNEANIRNLQRVTFGSTPTSAATATALEGKHLEVQLDGGGAYFDLAEAGESDFGNITVTGIFATNDVLEQTNLIAANITLDTDGKAYFGETDSGLSEGDTAYIRYTISVTSMWSTEIYGASNATVEGAARLQARNLQGGVVQIWDLTSVHLASNGDLVYPLEAIQTVPVIMTLQERAGTFGTLYAK